MYSKIIRTGAYVEIYDYEKEPICHTKFRKAKRRLRSDSLIKIIRRRDNANRARKSFMRLIRANLGATETPILLTLTFRETQAIHEGYRAVTLFFQRCRRSFGKGFRYIAVPEFGTQSTKRLHFHTIVWGFPLGVAYSERETRLLASIWGQGWLDCRVTDNSPKLAGYLAKYTSKAFLDPQLLNKKAYSCSRNVRRPLIRSTLQRPDIVWKVDLSTAEPLQERFFSTEWLGGGRYRLYKLNETS